MDSWVGCSEFMIFSARFCRILMSISSMAKWVTPLGRVFKIHDIFRHGFDKNDIVNS